MKEMLPYTWHHTTSDSTPILVSRDVVAHGILSNRLVPPTVQYAHVNCDIKVPLSISYNFQNLFTALLTTQTLYIQIHKASLEPVRISLEPVSALYANRSCRHPSALAQVESTH